MKHLFYTSCACFIALQGTLLPQEKTLSSKESFFLKRITEFWKDKDFLLVKHQVHQFLQENPQTEVADHLYAILGDLFFQEQNYSEALGAYQKIENQELKEKTLHHHTLCLYEMKNYEEIISLASPFLENRQEHLNPSKALIQFLLAESLYNQAALSQSESEQVAYLQRAKPLYQLLQETEYKDTALQPLAESHRILGEYPQACSLYLILAEKQGDKAEDYLFQTATLQLAFDKNAAIETYDKIVHLNGSKASDAAYNQFILLFQQERFDDLISASRAIATHVPEEKRGVFHFYLGQAHYNVGHFKDASSHFEQFIATKPNDETQKKSAYLTLISCAQEENNTSLFDHTLQELLSQFPQDKETAQVLLLHAQKAVQQERIDEAISDLKHVLATFPAFEQKEAILYDLALLLSQSKQWTESRSTFLTYIEQVKTSNPSQADRAWNYILNCSIQELKAAAPEVILEKKCQLASDLTVSLSKESVISSEERPTYHFLLSKTLFETSQYEKAIPELEAFLASYPDHPSLSEAALLLAFAYRERNANSEEFIKAGEKALLLNPHFPDRGLLHLQLFNACLTSHLYEAAASHLFECHVTEGHPIQVENQLWLANYYYTLSKQSENQTLPKERAIHLFKKILFIRDDQMNLEILPETAFLEVEALKLAELLSLEQKARLLSALTQTQNRYAHAPWKYQRQALFELGKTFSELNEPSQALPIYESLIQSSSHAPSYFSTAAILERNRILFAQCPEQERTENNPQITQILTSLKDLQIQKKLLSEPIHLESALAYVDIRTSLCAPETRAQTELFFLQRIQEDFNDTNDPISLEYHQARAQLPEKDALFKIYMNYIAAEMMRLESLTKVEERSDEKAEISKQMLRDLLKDPATPSYLQTRIENNLRGLEFSNQ